MRMALLALAVVGAAFGATTAPAAARDYPFCIKGSDYDSSVGDCRFESYAACLASASGLRAFCDANPFFRGPEPVDRRRASRRAY